MASIILEAESLTKEFLFPERNRILCEVSLYVHAGETVAITGPSGVGKSTLLHILGMLDEPNSGQVTVMGKKSIRSRSSIRNQHIGFVFQHFYLLEEHTVWENIEMPARVGRRKVDEAYLHQLLEHVCLSHRANHLAKQLSGGEKQRVAMARALCNRPGLILADEPSGNLDDQHSALIHQLLIRFAKEGEKKALVVVTHDRHLASLCDRIYLLHQGHLMSVQ